MLSAAAHLPGVKVSLGGQATVFPCPKRFFKPPKTLFTSKTERLSVRILEPNSRRPFKGFQPLYVSSHADIVENAQIPDIEVEEGEANKEKVRVTSDFSDGVWGDYFLSFTLDNKLMEEYTKEVEELKARVRNMLIAEGSSTLTEKIIFIDTLERVGIAYHFEKEIDEILNRNFHAHSCHEDDDLCTVGLQFRIFRQHGYPMHCGVFNKFLDNEGKFKETLAADINGMLSLYEATQVRTHKEDILEEALVFTTTRLKSALPHLSPKLAKQVGHALEHPLHKGMERIEVRYYIPVYEEDECRNEMLLQFAKIDFNRLQLLYQQELRDLSRWWKESDIISKYSYSKDRLVEFYFLIFALNFEPCYSLARIIPTQVVCALSIIDDTYDSYASLDEVRALQDAVQRWDMQAIKKVPDYLKPYYKFLLNLFQEIEDEMTKQGRPYSAHYTKASFKDVAAAYYMDSIWWFEKYPPTFDEYMNLGGVRSGYWLVITMCFMCMGGLVDIKTFEWLQTKPKIFTATEFYCRLIDDLRDYEDDKGRGGPLQAIDYYMNEYGMSKEEVFVEFFRMMEDVWKDMNEECLTQKSIPIHLLVRVVNLVRTLEVTHQYADPYFHPENTLMTDHIKLMFIDPIPV